MDKKFPSISVFFPMHNEEGNVEIMARTAVEVLKDRADDYEVIIVNDGSKDRTGEIADRLHEEDPHIVHIKHEVNRGYGGAVKTGWNSARYDLVFFTDGDNQFDLHEMDNLLENVDEYDIVVGYRINRQDPWIRKLNAWAWGTLVRFLFKIPVRDIDCAFKIFPRKAVDAIKLDTEGAMISTEMLAKAKNLGFTIKEVGVHHRPRQVGEQSGANIRVILRAFKELFLFYRRLKRGG